MRKNIHIRTALSYLRQTGNLEQQTIQWALYQTLIEAVLAQVEISQGRLNPFCQLSAGLGRNGLISFRENMKSYVESYAPVPSSSYLMVTFVQLAFQGSVGIDGLARNEVLPERQAYYDIRLS
ncbi:hypothetical protein [Pseudomonas viridiflava]|uniref:hypothetical protein n=1 Tax=Pseudomonas viridiflava TaxID=33069 RepID=UPI0013D781D5|nr:hypothetical protein [Pseudomonas viridiflava]